MADQSLPSISIIIPVKPGGQVLALANLSSLNYPSDKYEIIVAEGTRPSRQRNRAAEQASGELLYFLDDDSLVDAGSLREIAAVMADKTVAVVGGPSLTPATDSVFQRSVAAALSTAVGGGGVRNRYRKTGALRSAGDSELILCNLCFRRNVYLAAGGLDERLYPNEENELLDRLSSEGLRLVHDPEMAIERSQRRTVAAFVRQMFGYGRGRGEQTRISGKMHLATLVPPLFVLYLLLLLFCNNWYCGFPLLLYICILAVTAARYFFETYNPSLVWRLLLIIPAIHLLYGCGMLRGYLNPRFCSAGPRDAVTLRQIKCFGVSGESLLGLELAKS